jgi:hypothetical protein
MNMIYKRTAVQQCEKQNQSIGGSCAEKIKLFYFCPPPWPTQDMVGSGLVKNYSFSIILFGSCRAWKMLWNVSLDW